MQHEKLDNLVRIGKLKTETTSKDEIAGLMRSGRARLADCKNQTLNKESRFDLAYNAAHALALTALRAAGYRAEHHYLVFQCTQYTLDLPNEQWRVLDDAHRKRNIAEYEGGMDIDDALLEALIRVTDELAARVQKLGEQLS
jgi:hypothetical protein